MPHPHDVTGDPQIIALIESHLMDARPMDLAFHDVPPEERTLIIEGLRDIYRSLGGSELVVEAKGRSDGVLKVTLKPHDPPPPDELFPEEDGHQ